MSYNYGSGYQSYNYPPVLSASSVESKGNLLNAKNVGFQKKLDIKTNVDKFDLTLDDGKISTADKLKSFGKGFVSPVTSLFSSAKNFFVGAGTMLGLTAVVIASGGALAPAMIALGVGGGAFQFGKSAINASKATTDEEAKDAWKGMGTGTSAIAISVVSAKSSLKAAGFADDAANMNALQATAQSFKLAPSQGFKGAKTIFSTESLSNISDVFLFKSANNLLENAGTSTKSGYKPKLLNPEKIDPNTAQLNTNDLNSKGIANHSNKKTHKSSIQANAYNTEDAK